MSRVLATTPTLFLPLPHYHGLDLLVLLLLRRMENKNTSFGSPTFNRQEILARNRSDSFEILYINESLYMRYDSI